MLTHPRASHPPSDPPHVPPPLLHSQTPLQPVPQEAPESSDSEDEEALDLEPEIDEQSDDEDDRQAQVFLCAPPNQVTVSQLPPPTVRGLTATAAPQPPAPTILDATTTTVPQPLAPTGQGHSGFAVSITLSTWRIRLIIDNRSLAPSSLSFKTTMIATAHREHPSSSLFPLLHANIGRFHWPTLVHTPVPSSLTLADGKK